MNNDKACIDYENENKYLKLQIQQLERELKEAKGLDKYEKIPYWLRPDFKMDFTCSTK